MPDQIYNNQKNSNKYINTWKINNKLIRNLNKKLSDIIDKNKVKF
jgi:hypothetical protein